MTDEMEWGLKGYENIRESVQLRKMVDQIALKYVLEMRRKQHTKAKCVRFTGPYCPPYGIFTELKFIYLFNDALSSSDYTEFSNDRMINEESERM
jgi:hypothetical protein